MSVPSATRPTASRRFIYHPRRPQKPLTVPWSYSRAVCLREWAGSLWYFHKRRLYPVGSSTHTTTIHHHNRKPNDHHRWNRLVLKRLALPVSRLRRDGKKKNLRPATMSKALAHSPKLTFEVPMPFFCSRFARQNFSHNFHINGCPSNARSEK